VRGNRTHAPGASLPNDNLKKEGCLQLGAIGEFPLREIPNDNLKKEGCLQRVTFKASETS
jgi:hypothetical protein